MIELLAHYPAAWRGPVMPLGNHGGFSGAQLFRIDACAGPLCLRAWPADMTAARLDWIHALVGRAVAGGLDFVPHILPALNGATHVAIAGRLWELAPWMPGTASFHAAPTPARLRAACAALARLHRAWAGPPRCEPCPAVARRLAATRAWQPVPAEALEPWAAQAAAVLARRLAEVPQLLAPWLAASVPVQPCVCDVWHDHVLFTGDRVTGLVDFGSCKIDHVAVDLARLLGSLAGDDEALWAIGLDAYAGLCPLTDADRALARILDRTGTIVAIANWLRRLYRENEQHDRAAVAARVGALVARLRVSEVSRR